MHTPSGDAIWQRCATQRRSLLMPAPTAHQTPVLRRQSRQLDTTGHLRHPGRGGSASAAGHATGCDGGSGAEQHLRYGDLKLFVYCVVIANPTTIAI